jgi:hypothetical protein
MKKIQIRLAPPRKRNPRKKKNPTLPLKYQVWQEFNGKQTHIASATSRPFAVSIAQLLNKVAAKGAEFLVKVP